MKFSFGSRYTVCLSSFGRTALKGFKWLN
jgi:hypothetical protein